MTVLDWSEIVMLLGAAALIGSAIGLNRDFHHKPCGLRTLALVSLGSALAVMTALETIPDPSGASRVLQGIVAGLGFLGAGVIIREPQDNKIHGLTTAAAIWLTACIGSACGLGAWRITIVASIITGIVLAAGGHVEKMLHRLFEGGDEQKDEQE